MTLTMIRRFHGYVGPWGGNCCDGRMGRGTDIYGDNVTWVEKTPEDVYSMVLYNIWTKQSRTLNIASNDLVLANGQAFNHFDINENYIVWNNNGTRAAYLYDLNNDTYSVLATGTDGSSWFININNGKVVWDTNGSQLGVYDLKTKVFSKINTSTSGGAYNPVTDGDKVLYPGNGYYMFDITSPGEEVYSLNSSSSSVTVINPYKTDNPATTGIDERIVATIPTGAGPSDSALSPDETKLYILNSTAKTVTVAQTYDFVPVNTVNINPTNKQTATAVAGDNDSNTYVALKSSIGTGVVKKIASTDIETTLTVGVNPNGLKISPDNKKLLVSNGSSSNVTAIDLATFTIIEGSITTGAGPKLVKP